MGPPRTRAQHLLAQRGRFQEGSMNDRVSAVPPVHFLGPQDREVLERPVYAEQSAFAAFDPAYFRRREERQPAQQMPQPQPQPRPTARKPTTRMNIFGQVWEGVRGRLRLRRDADDKEKAREKKDPASSDAQDDRPSRDEVFASYQQLVASGFFSSHAIQSTRHGPPPNYRPSTSHGAPSRNAGYAPQWPLAHRPLTPQSLPEAHEPTLQTVCSPVSVASSRGTKRAAESPEPSVDGDGEQRGKEEECDDGEDESTLAHRFLPKRLRISASRDISLPKLRSVASRKSMRAAVALARRNVSAGAQEEDGKERELDKLSKKMSWAQQQQQQQGEVPAARASMDVLPRGRNSSEIHGSMTRRIRRPTSARNLRSAGMRDGNGGLKVVPDANRGIPRVPDIPVKFTYGEDRENGVPWRGLRR
ncbi:hypothetical protein MGU_04480 [Metarhizium guizhouense ARSEF 977]|uniref:Uncharacterized protein n=1 Tax=Metarhizium guizhouense (strain ARSEF 977) TaxID=1276136 RepID=A0A0B4GMX1_METGA|nr:hypothetical protein MGU_04480 [Metarhizium guizhouense ARSEF 977]